MYISKGYRVLLLAVVLLWESGLYGREYGDSAVWQGMNLKIDIGTPVLEVALSSGRVMSYEVALNANLQSRFYPTIEGGYGKADVTAEGGVFHGQGGYGRVGLDLSALKKSRKDNMLLVGLRLGTAVQKYSLTDVRVSDPYNGGYEMRDFVATMRPDVWGEVVAGMQVKVYKSFHMGWYVRMKILFTRKEDGSPTATYIPGYGYRQETNFGLNYYLGWKF